MEDILATLTHEEQALIGSVLLGGKATTRACLAGVVGIDFHGHAPCQQGFVREVTVQFSERPGRCVTVCLALLLRNAERALPVLLALVGPPFSSLTDVCQVFQANDAMWVHVHNAPTDDMVAILFQPSLSSRYHHQTAGSGTSAFFLQPFSQSRIVIGFGTNSLASIEIAVMFRIGANSQISLSDIDTNHVGVIVWRWLCYLNLKGDEQVELLAWFVIPEFSSSDMRAILNECHMFAIARVGHNQPPIQGQDTHLVLFLQAVIAMVVVGNRRRDVLRRAIQSLVTFLRMTSLAMSSILPHFGPQGFVGGSGLARDVTSHLGRYLVLETYLIIAVPLQGASTAHLAMLKSVATHIVQGIAIGQLCGSQCLELLWCRMQFEFGGEDLFHERSIVRFTHMCQEHQCVKIFLCSRSAPFLPMARSQGTPGATG